MTKTMRRWSMSAIGRDNLKLETVAIPEPGPGEIRVKVSAASLNYRDKMVIETGMGLTLPQPFTPVSDMAGVIDAIGPGVSRFTAGDRVMSTFKPDWIDGPDNGNARTPAYQTTGGTYQGMLADYVVFPEDWFVCSPATLDDAEASTLPVAGLTAWFALKERDDIKAGSTVLVQGTGGVALFGLQIAKAYGADVFVTSRSDEKLARVKALGADHGINSAGEDWVEAVYKLTGDRGVDHILEISGGANLGHSLRAIAVHGRISVIGVLEGFEVSGPVGPLLLKSPVIQGISVGHRRSFEDFVRAIDDTGIKPVIDARYKLEDLQAALDHLDRGPFGKIVIDLSPAA
ncbi:MULTISPECIES: zinc-dependent alcohol dehydrogenase family protein [unclassified Rhizobium]|uniref:zinc-dependent alcohol dehydrogenase family protein n=1 Tax=unclassified Rhizobium TaxID=2613769 RepID=UPI0007122E3B|nr:MULTISPECIES: NAD(P)-dependent alcohol dehydrogenase [unclassified Rhizobium]KQS98043.1 alcohol dehydrogenase [Rhizobium sp. Leaf386]KQT00302.1 alcohol dehydrogenase [Rhizobium sp. Leaf391]KQT97306.1 alcohol dehydrogenase [Rhizobium sp. Leaf453]